MLNMIFDTTVAYMDNTVGIMVSLWTVSYNDNRTALIMKIGKMRKNWMSVFRVKIAGRFIGKDYFGMIMQSAGDGGTLFFAGAELGWFMKGPLGQAEVVH